MPEGGKYLIAYRKPWRAVRKKKISTRRSPQSKSAERGVRKSKLILQEVLNHLHNRWKGGKFTQYKTVTAKWRKDVPVKMRGVKEGELTLQEGDLINFPTII